MDNNVEQNNQEKVFFKIIIPNYNNMPYIKKCLDSILEQTFQDFKIIIVDDMSTDLSDKFCEMYARKYPDKIVFIRLNTKGCEGGCRNIGINYNISAKYYMFIDSDDYLYSNNSLYILHQSTYKFNSDVILYRMIRDINGTLHNITYPKTNFILNKNALLSHFNSACGKIVKENKIVPFIENCNHGADTLNWAMLLDNNITINEIQNIIYVYRKNMNSITHNGEYYKHTNLFYSHLLNIYTNIKNPIVRDAIQYRHKKYLNGEIFN